VKSKTRQVAFLASLVALGVMWTVMIGYRLLVVGGFYDPPLRGDGRNVASYEFDLSTTLVPVDQIIAAGFARDGVKALVDPPSVTAEVALKLQAGHGPLLKPGVRAIGVEINGERRAYPVLIVQLHEIINDTLGGVPIAVTYNPLCDSAVVFDRRVGDEVLQFGVSGLLYNANTLMYDRRGQAAAESLWSQLQFRAIAGQAAAAGKTLKTYPLRMITLDHWLERYPDTSLCIGLYDDQRMKQRYKGNPYSLYYDKREIPFTVNPRVTDEPMHGLVAFDKIAAVRGDDGTWHVRAHGMGDDLEEPVDAQALWFAWYAMWPESVVEPVVKSGDE
jgi:hypothetical protein